MANMSPEDAETIRLKQLSLDSQLEDIITNPQLYQTVKQAGKAYGVGFQQLILDVAVDIVEGYAKRNLGNGTSSSTENGASGTKKRKIEVLNGTTNGSQLKAQKTEAEADTKVVFWCKDISFAMPARKKLRLEILGQTGSSMHSIRATNQQTSAIEYSIPIQDIEYAFSLPVPEKATRQQNFVIYPHSTSASEPFVFAVNETPIKDDTMGPGAPNGTATDIVLHNLEAYLSKHGIGVTQPRASDFASAIPQPQRKNENAYHVKAHRGSKDGYLFFLPNGILFGFRKPLAFYPFHAIQAISYTSVLQRTFNLVISVQSPEAAEGEAKEEEYSMLDQADFAGIDGYIKAHDLQDASMAEQRKAKAYGVNKIRGEDGTAVGVEEGGELEKAAQQAAGGEGEEGLDEEDEEEEDYDPGSEGESEGSGSESGDEDGEGDANGEEFDEEEEEEEEG